MDVDLKPWTLVAVVAFVFLAGTAACAQSCALCYTQAASAGARMIEALRSGILILIIPPTLMSVVLIYILYRKRRPYKPAIEPERSW